MRRWLLINSGIVVGVVEKEGNIVSEDFTDSYDTVQEDNNNLFNINDIFDSNKISEFYSNKNPLREVEIIFEITNRYKIGIDKDNLIVIGCNPLYTEEVFKGTKEQWENYTDEEIIAMAGENAAPGLIEDWHFWKPIIMNVVSARGI